MLDTTAAVIFVVTMLFAYFFLKKKSRLPPGPSRTESLKLLDSTPNEQLLLQWGRKYKDLFSVNITGFGTTIFLTSFDVIKKLFVQNAEYFSNRPKLWLLNFLTKGKGITCNLESWRQTRRFALHSMRDFGLGKRSIDERIQDEAEALVEQFRSKNGQPFDPEADIVKAVSNIICSITFGKRYSYTDPVFEEILKCITELFCRPYNISPLNSMPWLRHVGFLHKMINMEYFEEPFQDVKKFVHKEIENHRENFDPDNIRDLVDLYLQAEKNGFKDHEGMDEENLFQVIVDLFLAGTDTTTGTQRWIILHLLHNPSVQKKCQDEIFKVIGTERLPEYKERNNFPYLVATIQEALRIDTVALGSLFHLAEKDFEIGEYVIPKGASVAADTRPIMYDEQLWGKDVDKFRPERWLDEEGHVRSVAEFIPFSIGKRACPGEQLSRTELFINTVALLQRFTFQADDPENPPKIQGETGTTYTPKPFRIIAVPL